MEKIPEKLGREPRRFLLLEPSLPIQFLNLFQLGVIKDDPDVLAGGDRP